ncbi:MAG: NAD-dependent protein deacylase [Bifidobacteriaceae bacterium]|nr:NAD-dependent protein deacylase [Bifidobacteriaceae bacterium]
MAGAVAETLRDMVETSRTAVFFGGAGTSTESGIPDFRSARGVFNEAYPYPPEQIVARDFFDAHPREFFEFYRAKLVHPDARPNPAHVALAALEARGHLAAVVTQNIDGLHQMAGSANVIELHGSVHRNTCMDCGATFGLDRVLSAPGVPRCECGGTIKPDVVLYGEPLDDDVIRRAIQAISAADLVMVGGTSLAVYPAAGLLGYFRGRDLVVINTSPTPQDRAASLVIAEPIGAVFARAWNS